MSQRSLPTAIEVRGATVNNLADVDVDVPLNRYVGVTGVSGSGKSSLALGVLYAEGSRRYLDGLSTYQRRRIGQAAAPRVRSVEHVPAALALRQRPDPPGPRSSVATLSEVGAVLRLSFSRLGAHPCPEGHLVEVVPGAWMAERLTCPIDGITFPMPGAESFSSASLGACPRCEGLGVVSSVNRSTLVPDPSLTLDQGAVGPWRLTGRKHMPVVARELGVRTDVPFRDLTDEERHTVLEGPKTKRHVVITSKNGRAFEMDAVYESATQSVLSLGTSSRSSGERHGADRFLTWTICPDCHGSGLGPGPRGSRLLDLSLPEWLDTPLERYPALIDHLLDGVSDTPDTDPDFPAVRQRPAAELVGELARAVRPLLELGLSYLTPGRRGDTLSTGERQRLELAATAMRRTTGMLYVLDEPTVGLHPEAVEGLIRVMDDIVAQGNSLVVVDHDVAVLRAADQLIELGPGPGRDGGHIVAQGAPSELAETDSVTGPYLAGMAEVVVAPRQAPGDEWLSLTVGDFLTLHGVTARFPAGRLTVVTGVSGAGKTALVIDSLVPALQAGILGGEGPEWVTGLDAGPIDKVLLVDSTPIGANSRSTPATYSGIFDEIRKRYAATDLAKERGWGASWFSYNTASGGRCPECEGLGSLSLDLQYLPDLELVCPVCEGARYTRETQEVRISGLSIADTLALTVDEAHERWTGTAKGKKILASLVDVGLGYLTLGEPTPALSGGESQRLRLASELGKGQEGGLFVFDEPSIGLHPRDVSTLVRVFRTLVDAGATVIVIEHDLDVIANADWIIDLGPGGGVHGGRIVAEGTVEEIVDDEASVIAPWLRA